MNSLRVFFIFLVLIVMVGFGIWTLSTADSNETKHLSVASLSSSQVNLTLHKLLKDHDTLTTAHLNNLYDGRETIDTEEKLEVNTQRLAAVFSSLGHESDRDNFIKIFQGQIKEYELYTQGLREKDQKKIALAKQMFDFHNTEFSQLTNKLFPTISKDRGKELMDEQVYLTLAVVNAHAASDSAKEFNLIKDSMTQTTQLADELGEAIDAKKKQ